MKKFIVQIVTVVMTVALGAGLKVHAQGTVFTPPAGQPVHYNWGSKSPGSGIPADDFSAIFDQSRYFEAGDYFIQTQADDGVKVQVDNKFLINRWKNTSVPVINRSLWTGVKAGKHSIKTHYYEKGGNASVFSDVVPFDSWLAYYYPNRTLSGAPKGAKVIKPVGEYKKLSENLGTGAPIAGMKSDNFSARYTTAKRIPAGEYTLRTKADDGVRVYLDGKLVLNRWASSTSLTEHTVKIKVSDRKDAKPKNKNVHWIVVQYYDGTGNSIVEFSIQPYIQKELITKKTTYPVSLNDMVNKQMTVSPQTDKKYNVYLRSDALVRNPADPSKGTVQGVWNVRGGPGTNYWKVGQVNNQEVVKILSSVKAKDGWTWYKISYNRTWVNASPTDVKYYINPQNFATNTTAYYQFMQLSKPAGVRAQEVNIKILANKGILTNKGQAFINASSKYGVNEIYLISHALLETGNGTSKLANGILVSSVDGKPVQPRYVYNMYGINAKDSCPLTCGSEYAYKEGWFTPEASIIGGAEFIASGYINAGQDTLYKMRWNPTNPATHQYASDIGWAVKQTSRIANLYSLLDGYRLTFDVPLYK